MLIVALIKKKLAVLWLVIRLVFAKHWGLITCAGATVTLSYLLQPLHCSNRHNYIRTVQKQRQSLRFNYQCAEDSENKPVRLFSSSSSLLSLCGLWCWRCWICSGCSVHSSKLRGGSARTGSPPRDVFSGAARRRSLPGKLTLTSHSLLLGMNLAS